DLARNVDLTQLQFSAFRFQIEARNLKLRSLLAVQLDDQLLIDRLLDVFTLGQRENFSFEVVAVNLQPGRQILVAGEFLCRFQNRQRTAGFFNRDLVANVYLVRRDVHFLSVHQDMSVTYQLACLTAGGSETKPEDNAVETAFELLQEQFAGDARLARGL